MTQHICIAANNGEIGGGEVMLLNIARALRSLGHRVTVIAPSQPDELLEAARDEGFTTVALPAENRKAYMAQLRLWRSRNRQGLLWCNGLVPSLATAGDKNRIVHLHQLPLGAQKYALGIARRGALEVIVPSNFIAGKIKGSRVLSNWVSSAAGRPQSQEKITSTVRVGFLGRPSTIKGTHTLARALCSLNASGALTYELVIGGEAKFIDSESQMTVAESLESLGDKVRLLGWVTPEALFEQTDILVVPSEVDESFGLVAAEAMSARHPLIVSDAGALPEVVGPDFPWVFAQGNSAQLAHMIEAKAHQLIELPEQAENEALSAYWRWQENYSPEAGKHTVHQFLGTVPPSA